MTFRRETLEEIRGRRVAEREANMRALAIRPARALARGVYAPVDQSVVAVPKREYVRSKALLAAVRTLPCQVTGRTDGVEPAHSNWPQHGKAGQIKADDNRVAALHKSLHREIDQGHLLSAEERQELWWMAHCRTVRELLARGLWPAGIPVPQTEDFWK